MVVLKTETTAQPTGEDQIVISKQHYKKSKFDDKELVHVGEAKTGNVEMCA